MSNTPKDTFKMHWFRLPNNFPTVLVSDILNPQFWAHPHNQLVRLVQFNKIGPRFSGAGIISKLAYDQTRAWGCFWHAVDYKGKSNSERIEPWGVPRSTGSVSETELSTLTQIFLPSRKDLKYRKQAPVTPYSFKVSKIPKCHIRSKAAVVWSKILQALTLTYLSFAKVTSCCSRDSWSEVLLPFRKPD